MKFENIKGINYKGNADRIRAYKEYRTLVNTLLVSMDNIIHIVKNEIDENDVTRFQLEDYANTSYYHSFPTSFSWDIDMGDDYEAEI